MPEEQQNTNTIENLDTPSPGDCPATEVTGLVEELQGALAKKTEEFKELNDKYLRLAAEFDNYKRLSQRDQRDQIRFGNEQLLKDLAAIQPDLQSAGRQLPRRRLGRLPGSARIPSRPSLDVLAITCLHPGRPSGRPFFLADAGSRRQRRGRISFVSAKRGTTGGTTFIPERRNFQLALKLFL